MHPNLFISLKQTKRFNRLVTLTKYQLVSIIKECH